MRQRRARQMCEIIAIPSPRAIHVKSHSVVIVCHMVAKSKSRKSSQHSPPLIISGIPNFNIKLSGDLRFTFFCSKAMGYVAFEANIHVIDAQSYE